MIKHDNYEYWQTTIWDRYNETVKAPNIVKNEFLLQEQLTVSSIASLNYHSKRLEILDLACGTGRISEYILKATGNNIKLTLVDINPQALEKAKCHLGEGDNISYLLLDAYQLGEIFSSKFDVIIAMEFFHHISNLELLFQNLHKALKPNGLLIGNVFAKKRYKEWDRIKYGWLISFRRRALHALTENLYSHIPPQLQRHSRQHGFARISPLGKEELTFFSSPYFELRDFNESYYYWFALSAKQS